MQMKTLPPNSNTSSYNRYRELKPFEVEAGTIAPAFGKIGNGKQSGEQLNEKNHCIKS